MRLYRNKQGLAKGKNKVKQKRNSTRTKAASKKAKAAANAKKKAAKKAREVHKKANSLHKTRPELMAEMIAMVALWFPDRRFVLVVDSLYSGKSVLGSLPDNFDLIGPVHAKAALYAPAPKEPKRRGAPRKKGDRLSTTAQWENDRKSWKTYHFNQYGLHGTLRAKTRKGLYYTAGKDRLLRFVLSQDKFVSQEDPFGFFVALVDRSDALRLQAAPGVGRRSEPGAQSCQTHGPDVNVSVQLDDRVVRDRRPP